MSAGWASAPMCGFDVESIAIDTTTARIVTASVVIQEPGKPLESRDWLTNPGIEIPDEAVAIHGVTTEHARTHSHPARDVVRAIATALQAARDNNCPVVAYNVPYDLSVLHHELIRHFDGNGLSALNVGPLIDPLVLDRSLDRYRRGSRKLGDTCEHYGIRLAAAHTSSADALAALQLTRTIVQRYPHAAAMTLMELQTVQAAWYRESQLSFAGYLRTSVAQRILADAVGLRGDARTAKLSELTNVLGRADATETGADGWPLRRTS